MMDGWVRPTSSSRTRRREPEERASVVVADGYSNERASVGRGRWTREGNREGRPSRASSQRRRSLEKMTRDDDDADADVMSTSLVLDEGLDMEDDARELRYDDADDDEENRRRRLQTMDRLATTTTRAFTNVATRVRDAVDYGSTVSTSAVAGAAKGLTEFGRVAGERTKSLVEDLGGKGAAMMMGRGRISSSDDVVVAATDTATVEDDEFLQDMTEVLDEIPEKGLDLALHVDGPTNGRTLDEQIDAQRGLCSCGRALGVGESSASRYFQGLIRPLRRYQRCGYTDEVYCDECAPSTSFAVIPWRVLMDWDFKPRRVCARARDFLASLEDLPVLVPADVNPGLYAKIPSLAHLRDARVRIRAEFDALRLKSPEAADAFRRKAQASSKRVAHLFDDPERFSIAVLRDLHRNPQDVAARADAIERALTAGLAVASAAARLG